MTIPFLAHYGGVGSCGAYCFDTTVLQITQLAEHVQQPSGLLRHGWDQDHGASWADPVTGVAPIVWSRGTGWVAMSLVDVLDHLPTSHSGHAELLAIFRALAVGLRDHQDPVTGLWFQVVDQETRAGNWNETSGSAMFVYALKKGVDRGHLDPSFLDVAIAGWEGLKDVVESESTPGVPVISEAVRGMGIQTAYGGYVGQPRLENSTHGLCAILMAASQMEAYTPLP
jgi:unsaturated rhamnogalacturonyl hydrolase